jgi:hypothetical protein
LRATARSSDIVCSATAVEFAAPCGAGADSTGKAVLIDGFVSDLLLIVW